MCAGGSKTRRTRDIDPELVTEADGLEVLVEVNVRDAWLQKARSGLLVDIEDLVHAPSEVDNDRARDARRSAAVAKLSIASAESMGER